MSVKSEFIFYIAHSHSTPIIVSLQVDSSLVQFRVSITKRTSCLLCRCNASFSISDTLM